MINFLEAVKHQLHQFVETGHSKPIHLMQNHLINDIYRAIDHNQMLMLTSEVDYSISACYNKLTIILRKVD